MSFTSKDSNWIWAYKAGDKLNSNSNSASIMQHDSMGSFTLDLTTARGGSSSNPFIKQAGTSAAPAAPTGTGNIGASDSGSSSSSDSDSEGGMGASPMYLRAHGVIMGLAFV